MKLVGFEPFVITYGRGGLGRGQGIAGGHGSVTGKACPKGLYGVFCEVAIHFFYFLIFFF